MKIAIINCYFGKFPSYFQLWLDSCKFNSKFDFIIFTDIQAENYNIPSNVHIIEKSWDELIKIIQSKFSFKVQIESPYKLTDFKVAYGYIFSEYLEKYDYWGYCDIDLIFGNLSKYIFPRIFQKYEKIYRLGHLTLLENNEKMLKLFTKKGAPFSFEEVFSSKYFYSFDEHAGLMSIAKFNNIREYCEEDMADISCRISRLTVSRQKNYRHQVFYYENGHVFRAYINNSGEVNRDEFVYIHLQKRRMKNEDKNLENGYYILKNEFIKKNEQGIPSFDTVIKLSNYIDDITEKKEMQQYYFLKIKQFFYSSFFEKKIWLKQKYAEKMLNKVGE